MFRVSITAAAAWMLFIAGIVASGRAAEARQKSTPEAFMEMYRTSTNIDKKLEGLRGLEKIHNPEVDSFLVKEYGNLDGTNPRDARLLGGIFRVWATRPDRPVLPFLIYEGLFHDDPEVVRLCANAIMQVSEDAKAVMSTGTAKKGGDPAEELASDMIQRMRERAEFLPPIEKVLSMWSGKARPGFKPTADLKRKPDAKERAAAIEFWQGWFEQRFKHKLDRGQSMVLTYFG
jgi:hypothetical protein